MASKRLPLVVCDAGPLIHLEELGVLKLLRCFGEILVPESVWREVQYHRPLALRHRLPLHRVTKLPEPTRNLVELLADFSLDPGESDAFRLMQQFPEAILLTDDGAARDLAQELGYAVHGTIGVILLALEQGRKTKRQVINLLKAIPRRSSLYIDAVFLNAILTQVRERSS